VSRRSQKRKRDACRREAMVPPPSFWSRGGTVSPGQKEEGGLEKGSRRVVARGSGEKVRFFSKRYHIVSSFLNVPFRPGRFYLECDSSTVSRPPDSNPDLSFFSKSSSDSTLFFCFLFHGIFKEVFLAFSSRIDAPSTTYHMSPPHPALPSRSVS